MTMYLASYATGADFDCYRDDGGDADTMHDLAEPRGVILSSLDNIQRVLDVALADWAGMHDETDPMPKGEWRCVHNFNEHQTWEYVLVDDRSELKGAARVYGVVQVHPKEIY